MRRYKALFIFEKSLGDESVEKAVDHARSEVTQLGGTVLESVVLGKRNFARPLQKQESGVYAKLVFELDETQAETFQGRFKHNEEVFRVQVVRARETDGESAPVAKPEAAPVEPAPAVTHPEQGEE